MMYDASIRAKTDQHGVLRLEFDTGVKDADVEVILHVDSKVDQERWNAFVDSIAGKLTDDSFVRPDQGVQSERLPFD